MRKGDPKIALYVVGSSHTYNYDNYYFFKSTHSLQKEPQLPTKKIVGKLIKLVGKLSYQPNVNLY